MEKLISQEAVIIGKGNLGRTLCDILNKIYPDIAIRDKWRFQKENEWHKMEFSIMHICFPYFDKFVEQVEKYQRQYNPKYTIIHSDVPTGISRKCNAIKFRNLGMEANIGGENAFEMISYFENAGFSVVLSDTQEIIEEMKPFIQKEGGEMLFNRREILTRFIKENKR